MSSEVLFKCKIKTTKHGSKKNRKRIYRNRRTGRLFIGQEAATKSTLDQLLSRLQIEKLKSRIDTIECDIQAKIIFYFPQSVYFTKKGHRSSKIADLSNLYQGVEDALQKAKIIKNDSQICSHDGSKRVPCDGTDYWLEIQLLKYLNL